MRHENEPQGNIEWLETYGLLLEDKVSCDSDNCDNQALYWSKVSCCGAVFIACAPCMRQAGMVIKQQLMHNRMIECTGCGKKSSPVHWMSAPQRLALDTSN